MEKFTVACVQINSGNDMNANIARASELVREAAERGSEFVATPENVAFMSSGREDLFNNSYPEGNHPALKEFQELARQLNIYLLVGSLAVKLAQDDKLANRSFLLNPAGEVLDSYDKIHMYDVDLTDTGGERHKESDTFKPGDKAVVTDLPWGKLGMTICYDLRFPHLYRSLARGGGAEILAVPSAFTRHTGEMHWHTILRARAIENESFVIAPAQTGSHSRGRKTYGHSLVINPQGEVLADGGEEEGIILAEIDIDLVEQTRIGLPSLEHDRKFIEP